MRFDLITIFPDFFAGPLDHGIVRRAREAGIVQIHVQDLREVTKVRHKTVDDRPFGGGEGMVLKPEPLLDAVTRLLPGALGNEASTENESFRQLETDDSISLADNSHRRKTRLLLDYPHY